MPRKLLFFAGTGLPVAATIWGFTHVRRVINVDSLADTPASFGGKVSQLAALHASNRKPPPTWGYYQRNLDRHYLQKSTNPLLQFVRGVFASSAYSLERNLSNTLKDPGAFEMRTEEQFGNLRLVEMPHENEVFFRYEHRGFDFLLYFGVFQRSVSMGFIELSGDALEDLGSRIYTRFLVEGGARGMMKTE
ncbi:hypothetical protein HDU67_005878 [Dinochytrium kinnereticum]|nr:hypothetical protein HDU67_005878 [Dinochytrium kinnereticum]